MMHNVPGGHCLTWGPNMPMVVGWPARFVLPVTRCRLPLPGRIHRHRPISPENSLHDRRSTRPLQAMRLPHLDPRNLSQHLNHHHSRYQVHQRSRHQIYHRSRHSAGFPRTDLSAEPARGRRAAQRGPSRPHVLSPASSAPANRDIVLASRGVVAGSRAVDCDGDRCLKVVDS